MSTRAVFGFAIEGEEKLGFNAVNSYPAGLGEEILAWLRSVDLDEIKEKARSLQLVDPASTPSLEQITQYKTYATTRITGGSLSDWYVLLRELQGDLAEILEVGVILDGTDAIEGAHYGYVIDFDINALEIYGVSHQPNNYGRFPRRKLAGLGNTFIYPMSLLASYALDNLPENLDDLSE